VEELTEEQLGWSWGEPPYGGPQPWHDPTPVTERRGLRAHPRAAGLVVVLAFGVVTSVIVAVTLLGTHAPTGPVPPNQAGYLWCCNVRDVSAQWTVPMLVHPASVGAEAVWVGAQTDDGSFFLQVGTNEYVSGATSQYQAFWSDGPLDGAPQDLGVLAPGDVVRAKLVHDGAGWAVTFVDQTQGWTRTVRPHYDVRATNALAEWIEEDPVAVDPVRGSSLFRMAVTRGTRVSNLLVNDAPPQPDLTESESFVDAAGTTFSPTVLAHDQFGFRPW
jgi:hypothetical protein